MSWSNANNQIPLSNNRETNPNVSKNGFSQSCPNSPIGVFSDEFDSLSCKNDCDAVDTVATPTTILRFRSQRLAKLHERFSLPINELLLQTFVCALDKGFLLQGKMYIFSNYIAFYASMLGIKTFQELLRIPIKNIERIERENTLIFPNAIKIVLIDQSEYMFRSFLNREKAITKLQTTIIECNGQVVCDENVWTKETSTCNPTPKQIKTVMSPTKPKTASSKLFVFEPNADQKLINKPEMNELHSDDLGSEFSSSKSNTNANVSVGVNVKHGQQKQESMASTQNRKTQLVDTMHFSQFNISPIEYDTLDYTDVSSHEFNCSLNFFWKTFWDTHAKFSIAEYMYKNSNVSNLESTEWQIDTSVNDNDNNQNSNKNDSQSDENLENNMWYQRQVTFNIELENLPKFAPRDLRNSFVTRIERCCKLNDNAILVHRIIVAKDVPYGKAYEMHEKWTMRQRKVYIGDTDGNNNGSRRPSLTNNQINTFSSKNATIRLYTNLVVSFAIRWIKKEPWQFIKSQIYSHVKASIKGDFEEKYTKIIDGKIAEYLQRPLAEQEICESLGWLEEQQPQLTLCNTINQAKKYQIENSNHNILNSISEIDVFDDKPVTKQSAHMPMNSKPSKLSEMKHYCIQFTHLFGWFVLSCLVSVAMYYIGNVTKLHDKDTQYSSLLSRFEPEHEYINICTSILQELIQNPDSNQNLQHMYDNVLKCSNIAHNIRTACTNNQNKIKSFQNLEKTWQNMT